MKKDIILVCICASISLTACDNYLDIIPKGKSILSTTEDYLGLLEPIDNEYNINDFGFVANEQTDIDLNELESYKEPLRSSGFFWDENYDRANKMTDGSDCAALYNKCYSRIARYNILLDNMASAEGPESDKIRGIAQAKVMRAYNHFFLLNTFAKPYNPATAATDPGIIVRKKFVLEEAAAQLTVAETYAFILQSLNEAISDLPEKSVNGFQPDKAFGYAFRAKVYLYTREFDKALSDALEVLKFSNHELWNLSVDYATFAAQHPEFVPPIFDPHSIYRTMLTRSVSHPENLIYCHNGMAGKPMIIRKYIKETFNTTSDLRYTVISTPQEKATTEPGCLYFMNAANMLTNESGMRLSEIYLIIAECYARQGNIDLTLKYINDLRRKRIELQYYRDLLVTDVDNNKDKALKLVREEKVRELFGSCNSFFDMRRFCTEFNETLTKTYTDSQGTTHTYTLKPDSHLLTFPFPVKAMQTSNLVQNSK